MGQAILSYLARVDPRSPCGGQRTDSWRRVGHISDNTINRSIVTNEPMVLLLKTGSFFGGKFRRMDGTH